MWTSVMLPPERILVVGRDGGERWRCGDGDVVTLTAYLALLYRVVSE